MKHALEDLPSPLRTNKQLKLLEQSVNKTPLMKFSSIYLSMSKVGLQTVGLHLMNWNAKKCVQRWLSCHYIDAHKEQRNAVMQKFFEMFQEEGDAISILPWGGGRMYVGTLYYSTSERNAKAWCGNLKNESPPNKPKMRMLWQVRCGPNPISKNFRGQWYTCFQRFVTLQESKNLNVHGFERSVVGINKQNSILMDWQGD